MDKSNKQKAVHRFAKKKPLSINREGLFKNRQRPTLPGVTPVPLAQVGLTSLFGMGRGEPHRYSYRKSSSR